MADLRILAVESMVGANHPTLSDTLNRLTLVSHNADGTHKFTTDTTQSTSTSTGAIVTAGGLGVAKDVYVGGTIHGNLAGNVTGDLTGDSEGTHKGLVNELKGDDLTAASTVDLAAATGNYVNVTGNTTITSFGTADAGIRRTVNFTGTPVLTYNATSMILPGADDIQIVAGDAATFVSLGSGNWKCINFTPFSGFNQNAAKAWVSFDGSNGNIKASFNVTSVTHNGTGIYTVNFTTAFADANYCVIATATDASGAGPMVVNIGGTPGGGSPTIPTTTTCRLGVTWIKSGGTLQNADTTYIYAAFFR